MKLFKKQLYYAHSMRIYNSLREAEETKLIKEHFNKYQFFCPNKNRPKSWINNSGSKIMLDCLQLVRQSKLVVASEYKNQVGKGVFAEVSEALSNNIPCYVLRDGVFIPIQYIEVEDADDWAVRYGRLIAC
jgi:hypothetical protein